MRGVRRQQMHRQGQIIVQTESGGGIGDDKVGKLHGTTRIHRHCYIACHTSVDKDKECKERMLQTAVHHIVENSWCGCDRIWYFIAMHAPWDNIRQLLATKV